MTRVFLMAIALAALAISGCTSTRTSAPVFDRPPQPAAAPEPPAAAAQSGVYLVKRGDTLYSIALEHGVDSYSFNGPIWSISLEVIAYGVFFVVARFIGISVAVNAGLILLLALLDAAFGHHPAYTCLIYFYCGALAFKAFTWMEVDRSRVWKVLIVAMVVVTAVGVLGSHDRLSGAVVALIVAPIVVLFSAQLVEIRRRSVGEVVTVLGNATYSSYLLHFPLQLGVVMAFEAAGQTMDLSSNWFFSIYILGTVALSVLCYKRYERPAQNWLRRKFARRQAPA